MKATMHDHDEQFSIELEPETIAEAAMLVRFGLNVTKEVKCADTIAYRDGTFLTWIAVGKRKQECGTVKRYRRTRND